MRLTTALLKGFTVPAPPGHPHRGVTLVELMVVISIVGILASLAYPSYTSYLQRSRRAEALAVLMQIQMAQERWRASNPTYTDSLEALKLAAQVSHHYTFDLALDASGNYVATATTAGPQAADTTCATLSLTVRAGQPHMSSTGSGTPSKCWGMQ